MKKAVVVLFALILVMAFTGCNKDNTVNNVNQNNEQNINEVNESPNVLEQQEETPKPNIGYDGENTIDEYDCNIQFDYSKYPERTNFSLKEAVGFDEMIAEVKKIDSSFKSEGYYVCICINADCKSGSIMFQYFIGDVIETNKTYLFSIDNGMITKLLSLDRPVPANKTEFEKELIDRVNDFKTSYEPEEIDETNVTEIREKYLYNYNTGELKYVRSVFYQVEAVVTDECTEVIIE